MKRLSLSICLVVLACGFPAVELAARDPVSEQTSWADRSPSELRAAYENAVELSKIDPGAAFAAMDRLAEAGYPRAIDRLAYFHLKGIGTTPDTEAALRHYSRAFDAGRERSLLSLGKVLLSNQRPLEALNALNRAVDLEIAGAEATRALADISGQLGPESNPIRGWAELLQIAQTGDRTAELGLLKQIANGARANVDRADLIERLTRRADGGDGKAAEALLLYYRKRGGKAETVTAERERLLTHPKLRAKIAAVEGLYLARDSNPARFWSEAERLLQSTPSSDFARALAVTAKINRNAYVRIVQLELRELGYLDNNITGYLSSSTIRAVNRFCRTAGIWQACRFGPLKSIAVKAIAAEFASRKADRLRQIGDHPS